MEFITNNTRPQILMPILFKQNFIPFALLLVFTSGVFSASPNTFYEAKKIASNLFESNRVTLYCSCSYDKYNAIDLASCGMESASMIKRAHRVEWEHMMPAENFGRHFKCWREPICLHNGKPFKGRKCCEKIDAEFKRAESELYNLWPSVGLVNQARSNYRYSVLPKKNGFYGCTFEVDNQLRKIEPADRAKGIVARANLFMAQKYYIQLSPSQQKLFEIWNKEFPPTSWEKIWASKIAEIEGYSNPYIRD